MRVVLGSWILGWAGTTVLLAELRWFRRRSLVERLRPYAPAAARPSAGGGGVLSLSSFRDVVGPLASGLGDRLGRLTGINEPVGSRLERVHDDTDTTTFRLRQLAWCGIGGLGGAAFATLARLPAAAGLAAVAGGGLLGALAVEQRLATRSRRWQQRVLLELPVVAEQLGMLLSAGYSVGAALHRLASRGAGATGQDLQGVVSRIRHGVAEVDALREWATSVDVEAVERLVAILALNRETGDLGRLISDEARVIRREVQRQLIETIERRAQQVWVPVTVATLVPGVLFLAVPFVEALKAFSGG